MAIFEDGFESNDFSAWTGTGGAPAVVGDPTRQGSYAMERDGADDRCYVSFTGTPTAYARAYWQTDTLPSTGESTTIIRLFDLGAGQMNLNYRNNGGTLQWHLDEGGGTGGSGTFNQDISTDTWYCLEILYDDTGGSIKLWVDGVERISSTPTRGYTIDYFGCGIAGGLGYTHTDYFDCAVVDSSPIGCISEGGQQLFTLITQEDY
jgi:hypothetical protein